MTFGRRPEAAARWGRRSCKRQHLLHGLCRQAELLRLLSPFQREADIVPSLIDGGGHRCLELLDRDLLRHASSLTGTSSSNYESADQRDWYSDSEPTYRKPTTKRTRKGMLAHEPVQTAMPMVATK